MSVLEMSLTALAAMYTDSSSDDEVQQLMEETSQGSKVVRLEIDADAASIALAVSMESDEPVSFRQQYDDSASVVLAFELEHVDHVVAQDAALARELDFKQHSPERGSGVVIPKGAPLLVTGVRLFLIARSF